MNPLVPNKNVVVPPYDILTEGYPPHKIKQAQAKAKLEAAHRLSHFRDTQPLRPVDDVIHTVDLERENIGLREWCAGLAVVALLGWLAFVAVVCVR